MRRVVSPAYFARSRGESAYPRLWAGCVGAWCPSLGPTGATLRDWAGRANHGTLTNMTLSSAWEPNAGRYALLFDGSNDYVTAGPNGIPTGSAARTISAWFKQFSTPSSAYNAIVQLVTSSGQTFVLQNSFDGGPNLAFTDGVNGSNNLSFPSVPALNVWHHVAITLSSNNYVVYLDGSSVLSGTFAVSINTGTITEVRIGARSGFATINGYVDNVAIYGRALASSEVILTNQIGRGGMFQPRERIRFYRVGGGRLLEMRRRACA